MANWTRPRRCRNCFVPALSRVWKLTTGYGTTVAADEQIATFTGNGQVETLKDAENNRTTYEYDGHDRRVKTRFPVTTKGADQSSTTDYEQITYDANSNVWTFRTRRAETIQLTYDNLDRLITKLVPERSGLASTHTRDVYFGYDLFGDMTYARFDSASGEGIANAFDALGQLTSTTNNMDGISRTLGYLYDVAGNLTRVTHPDNNYFTYARNAVGGLDQVNLNASTPLLKPILDAPGRLNRLDRWRTSPGDWLARNTIGYDSVSRLASLATDVVGSGSDTTTSFAYNPAGQIASTTRTTDVYAWNGQVNADLTYTPDGLNRYTGASFNYDANHNLTSDSANTFVYDVENRLVTRSGAASATLRYDPLGRLHEVVSGANTRRFLYDGFDLVAEYNASGTLQRRYVHGLGAGDDPQVWFDGSGVDDSARRYLFADERGTIVTVTDSAGTTLRRNNYDEYGVPGPINLGAFQYTGQVWLPELGMYYYKARMYSPVLGRFMQTDPIGYGDGMNMYNYVHNDPLNFTDSSGLGFGCSVSTFTLLDRSRVEVIPLDTVSTGSRSAGRQDGSVTATSHVTCNFTIDFPTSNPDSGKKDGTPQAEDPCFALLPDAPGRSPGAPRTINEGVSITESELATNLQGLDPEGAYWFSVGAAAARTRPGGTWATGRSEGNLQYGAVLTTLGIPQWMQLIVGDADEAAEKLGIKRPNDNNDTWTDTPVSKALIRAGAECARR